MKKSTQVLAAFLTIIMLLCCGTYATEKTSFDSEPLCHMTYHDVCRAIQTEEFDAVMRSYLSDLNEEGFDIRDISLGTPYNYLVANNSKIVAELAGAEYVDTLCVVDGNLISAVGNPGLIKMMEEFVKVLK